MIFQFAPFYRPEKVLLKEDSGFTSELGAAHAAKAVAFLRTRPTLMTIDFAITFRNQNGRTMDSLEARWMSKS